MTFLGLLCFEYLVYYDAPVALPRHKATAPSLVPHDDSCATFSLT